MSTYMFVQALKFVCICICSLLGTKGHLGNVKVPQPHFSLGRSLGRGKGNGNAKVCV